MTDAKQKTPATPGDDSPEVFFGDRLVPENEKAPLVRDLFQSVAGRYDLMNDLMSAGIHRLWKDTMVENLNMRPGQRLLDVAGGTGDIAFRVVKRLNALGHTPKIADPEDMAGPNVGADPSVVVCDLTPGMLAVGRDRAIDRNLLHDLRWVCGNAECLPLPKRSFDGYSIAFGLRNVTHIDAALKEAYRVLKPGGHFVCLEFSQVVLPLMDRLYQRYSDSILPSLGGLVAGDREAYSYLIESIRRFPPQEALCERIAAAGFSRVRYRNLSAGIAAIHTAWRL